MDERAGAAANERIVNSLTLNDLEGTDLAQQLERIRHAHRDDPLRVGVVGVWTEAKVSFLLYDLKTRLGIDELATCSALTASASRAQHFNALAQLEKLLGVACFDSRLSSPTGSVPGHSSPFPIRLASSPGSGAPAPGRPWGPGTAPSSPTFSGTARRWTWSQFRAATQRPSCGGRRVRTR